MHDGNFPDVIYSVTRMPIGPTLREETRYCMLG